ncbi:MAG: hypothetical protein AAGH99_06620 [Planctomycetota bacterium]
MVRADGEGGLEVFDAGVDLGVVFLDDVGLDEFLDVVVEPAAVGRDGQGELDDLVEVGAAGGGGDAVVGVELFLVALDEEAFDDGVVDGEGEDEAGLVEDQLDAFEELEGLLGEAAVEVVDEDDDLGGQGGVIVGGGAVVVFFVVVGVGAGEGFEGVEGVEVEGALDEGSSLPAFSRRASSRWIMSLATKPASISAKPGTPSLVLAEKP